MSFFKDDVVFLFFSISLNRYRSYKFYLGGCVSCKIFRGPLQLTEFTFSKVIDHVINFASDIHENALTSVQKVLRPTSRDLCPQTPVEAVPPATMLGPSLHTPLHRPPGPASNSSDDSGLAGLPLIFFIHLLWKRSFKGI